MGVFVFASIDAGSHAVRLLLARVGPDGRLVRLRYERTATRLAEGFLSLSGAGKKSLLAPNMERTLETLKKYSEIISSWNGLSGMRAVGTSALREAANGQEFIRRVFEHTGIRLEAITHEEEARLSALGVTGGLGLEGNKNKKGKKNKNFILDIGGGSTEWMLTEGRSLVRSGSFPVGVVKLAGLMEREGETVLEKHIVSFVSGLRQAVSFLPAGTVFIVTGGTASAIAAIDLGLTSYEHEKVHGRQMDRKTLERMYLRLAALSLDQRGKVVAGLEPDRADLIIPGLGLTINIMREFSFQNVISNDTGLPEGIIFDLYNRSAQGGGR